MTLTVGELIAELSLPVMLGDRSRATEGEACRHESRSVEAVSEDRVPEHLGETPGARAVSVAMTDADILADMDAGLIRVDDDLSVWKWHPRRRAMVRLAERTHPRSGRVTFNLVKGTGPAKVQRTVYRNKLVWLWHHRIPVPDGMHIDHANGFDTDDRIDNLRLREWVENSADNTHKAMRELSEYFLLAELGFDPDAAYP